MSPALVSTIKVKEAGFGAVMNTDEAFTHSLTRLIERGVAAEGVATGRGERETM